MQEQNSTYNEPEFQKLVATLAKLQGNPKAALIDVVEKEFDFLSNKVRQINQQRKIKMNSIKRKIENLTEQCNQTVVSAQNFTSEVEKSLKQSQRQYFKRIQRLQRDRLQKQIEIKTIIDQQQIQQEKGTMTNQICQQFTQQNQSMQNINLQTQLWFSQMNNYNEMKQPNEMKQISYNPKILRDKFQKINIVKTRATKIIKNLQQRLERMKRQRQRWEGQSLKQIQEIVENLMKRRRR